METMVNECSSYALPKNFKVLPKTLKIVCFVGDRTLNSLGMLNYINKRQKVY